MKSGWIIKDNNLDTKCLLKNESIYNVANGYLGVRGNFEEDYPEGFQTIRGTYINAFYENTPIAYGEKAYAFPETMQKIVNVTDAQNINIIIDNEKFSLFQGKVKSFERYLDMSVGCYIREIHWESPKGRELKIKITRLASLRYLELFAIHYEIERINFDGEIILESSVNGDVKNFIDTGDPRVSAGHANILQVDSVTVDKNIIQVLSHANNSGGSIAVTTCHRLNTSCELHFIKDDKSAEGVFRIPLSNKKVEFTKYNIYTDSRRYESPRDSGIILLERISAKSFRELLEEQSSYLRGFWSIADIHVEGDEALQQCLRYNMYQLLQSVGKDSVSNIAAKGLSGEGYEGHYFWDTEIYILPFFTLCCPELAKQLLKYRYTILEHAKKRSRELGHKKGAAYPWRTITGEECSSYFPAGTAQYHINGDIAYSYVQYYLATGDMDFIKNFGAEVIFETARIWLEIGHFDKGFFKIDAVTGPDEYTAIVNNNYYTNVMAKYNLKWASKLYHQLFEEDKELLQHLCKKISLEKEEIHIFERAYTSMYLPYNEDYKINPQDDSFLSKAIWNFEDTPADKYPLLLNYHPLTIYRYQVLKQADTVLAHFLAEDEVDFDTIKNSYDYYEKITTHDSSLSSAVYSIMASKVGYYKKAYDYFIETARLDLDDTHGNTKDGLHTANMGGTWMSVVYGFAGLRIKEDCISLNPRLPKEWKGLKFKFLYKGACVSVDIQGNRTIINCDEPVKIKLNNQWVTFTS